LGDRKGDRKATKRRKSEPEPEMQAKDPQNE